MSINKKAMDAACAAYEIAQIEDRSMYSRVKICIEAYEATKTEQPVSSYAGGVSEIHTREPSDSTSCAPDGRVMDVLPTPAPTLQPVSSRLSFAPENPIEGNLITLDGKTWRLVLAGTGAVNHAE